MRATGIDRFHDLLQDLRADDCRLLEHRIEDGWHYGDIAVHLGVPRDALADRAPGPRHHGSQGRRTATRERAPAPEWWPPAAPTHGKRPGPGPVTAAMGLRAVPET